MKVIYLSHPVCENTPLYANAGHIKRTMLKSLENRDSANASYWELPAHSSTHIDAPCHFISKGKSITDFSACAWFFNNVALLNLKTEKARLIRSSDIESKLKGKCNCDLLLLKTGFERFRKLKKYWSYSFGLVSGTCGTFGPDDRSGSIENRRSEFRNGPSRPARLRSHAEVLS